MWDSLQIGKVCQTTRMRDPRRESDGSFLYVDISSIDRDLKIITNTPEIIGAEAPSRARKVIRTGDILISTVRPNLNAVAIVPTELDGQIASTGFCVLRPKTEVIDGKYLFYFSLTTDFIGVLSAKVRGAHYPAVSDRDVKAVELPLPPLSEQRGIVEILDQGDALRRKRAEVDTKADRILPALFHKMFGDPATNPKRILKKKLGDLIKVKSGNFLPAKDMNTEGEYPVYGGNGINGYHTEYMFEKSMIVVGRVGVYCGAVHYSKPKCWVTDNALYVSKFSDELHIRYLAEALRVADLNKYAGRAGQPLVSGSRIYPVEILVPQLELQKKFAALILRISRLDSEKTIADERINLLFNVLLYQAFSGNLTSKWREAHMNELLAEMEQQQKDLKSSSEFN